MPQFLTEEQARTRLCPFMSSFLVNPESNTAQFVPATCMVSECACWGWVDPERGQLGGKIERVEMPSDEMPEGDDWRRYGASNGWQRLCATGPRRGRCEAGGTPE